MSGKGRFARAACVIVWLALAWPGVVHAGEMDVVLSRLRIPPKQGGCPAGGPPCPDNEAFERLVSELSVALAPPVLHGAATFGPSGFYVGLTSTLAPISADERFWIAGTEGSGQAQNRTPVGVLSWNRLEARKGLPFGFELGASVGQGLLTSMWIVGAELKWALFEGFHSGLGGLPDVAVSGILQASVGAEELSLHTDAVQLTLSKPFVIASRYRVVPFASAQLLLVRASTSRVDLTPNADASSECDPATDGSCGGSSADLGANVAFDSVSHTRTRLFLGAELSKEWFLASMSLGLDAALPDVQATTPNDGVDGPLSRQITFQLALGLRY